MTDNHTSDDTSSTFPGATTASQRSSGGWSHRHNIANDRSSPARVDASTQEFFAHQINQRPAFVLTDPIGDKAVFSGLVRLEPLAATIDAMLADTKAYAAHAAHFGKPPA